MTPRSDLLLMIAGFLVWVLAFVALYTVQGLGCAQRWDGVRLGPVSLHASALWLTWLAHIAAAGLLVLTALGRTHGRETTGRFLRIVVPGANVTALAAIIWTGLPILFASTCL